MAVDALVSRWSCDCHYLQGRRLKEVQTTLTDVGKHAMTSQGPSPAELESPSRAEDALLTYLTTSIHDLREHAEAIFKRYKAAGVKYHAMPLAVRTGKRFRNGIIDMLDETYLLTTDGQLAALVVDTFGDLIYCIVEARKTLSGTSQVIETADNFVFDAFVLAERLEKKMCAIESAVADVVAMKKSLMERGKLRVPDPHIDAQIAFFEDWAEAVADWSGETHRMGW